MSDELLKSGRWIRRIGPGGGTVELDDSTTWEVDPTHAPRLLEWRVAAAVEIVPGDSTRSTYTHELRNPRGRQSVRVKQAAK